MAMYSFFSLMTLLVAALLIPIVSLKKERYIPYIAVSASLIALVFSALTVPYVLQEGHVIHHMEEWAAPYGITLVVDGFSMLLIMMITLIGFLVTLFSFRFIRIKRTEYYSLICLLQVGLLGIAHSGDMFNLFVFLEITSIASYILASYYKNPSSIEGAIKYLIMGSFGTSMVLLGIAFLYGLAGTLNMADLAIKLAGSTSPILPISIGLIMTGLGIKAAFIPFHSWKPDVVSVMPASVGALFSGLSTSIGIYAIMRIMFIVFSGAIMPIFFNALIVIGLITMVLGAIMAMQQSHLLRLLAYSAISQVGYILVAFGVGGSNPLGLTAGVFHMFNVAIFESLLFLVSGAVMHKTGTYDMNKLGGMARASPFLAYAFLIGILANIGVPFFSGFSSKWLIYVATLTWSPLITMVAVVVSVITLLYCLRAYTLVFMGNTGMLPGKSLKSMKVPIIILAAICIMFGLFPQLGISMSEYVAASFGSKGYISAVLGGLS